MSIIAFSHMNYHELYHKNIINYSTDYPQSTGEAQRAVKTTGRGEPLLTVQNGTPTPTGWQSHSAHSAVPSALVYTCATAPPGCSLSSPSGF
jgi:hypothetical protein